MIETTAGLLGLIGALGLVVNRIVELVIAPFYDRIPALTSYKWTLAYWAFAVGVALAFSLSLDMLPALAAFFEITLPPSVIGTILTGLALGGGAAFWHRLFTGDA
jgi:hypothetical protein